jgi:hypothetical protein
MAVTGATAKYKLPYFKPSDSPPDMAAGTQAISDRVEELLAKGGDVSIAADGTITIGAKKVTEAMLADDSVTAAKIASGAVGTSELAEKEVTTAKVGDKAITEAKLADDSVTAAKIAENAVGSSEIAADAVGSSEIAENAVGASEIAAGAVGESELADGAANSRKIKPTVGLITSTKNLTLSGSWQDVPGAELTITPAVASKLKITAFFDLEGNVTCKGAVSLDGVDQTTSTALMGPTVETYERHTVGQVWLLSLTAASHTIKLRAWGSASSTAHFPGTQALYELVAA